jgi:colanic acid/amylovoran biosynthesis protein
MGMNIEIIGTGFQNKGAHLMLIAIVQELSRWNIDAHLAIRSKPEINWDGKGLGLYQKLEDSESCLGNMVSGIRFRKEARERHQMILDREIDIVLDASGFKYSDLFGHRSILDRAKKIANWKRSGKRIVLLPQAFGPLEAQRVRKAAHILAEHADLIYARDQDSFDHLNRLVGPRDSIRMSPDFTNLVAGHRPDHFKDMNKRACLIPNAQMVVRTSDAIGRSYVPFIAGCARFLSDAGLNPFILLHEMGKDGALAHQVQDLSGVKLEIIEEADPLLIKGIIGNCRLVVGSRYHALISALSQGVPAVATSWSHKYECLYEEYRSPELLISDLDFQTDALPVLQKLTDPVYYDKTIQTLKRSAQSNMEKTKKMWRAVREVILPETHS